ncbi:unnamed protein product [Vitrella brassicaformis CCMP3155]|uniref:Chromo domain-containing protein n=2 Tax=Vitrella brassicaformis TaxID=1169539 RepID=A0A0G4F5X9_VITBC|nr:unnamed protein product [Vitrella brassicaformis CCMP3155]|mmetsp:Transcript_44904/g.111538  ORF Transcript_44904/g.111538 Transcript_44904/m.111538 type:complete len:227 (+) Transcript_44904:71-751(+)|eukprot:CEM07627.1 unnamed protein product [Vitrella brassicaformis CCMP3155]
MPDSEHPDADGDQPSYEVNVEDVSEEAAHPSNLYVVEHLMKCVKYSASGFAGLASDVYSFYVKWSGYDIAEATWEPEEHLETLFGDLREQLNILKREADESPDGESILYINGPEVQYYIVEALLQCRRRQSDDDPYFAGNPDAGEQFVFLVSWAGHNEEDNGWEPESHLSGLTGDLAGQRERLKSEATAFGVSTFYSAGPPVAPPLPALEPYEAFEEIREGLWDDM